MLGEKLLRVCKHILFWKKMLEIFILFHGDKGKLGLSYVCMYDIFSNRMRYFAVLTYLAVVNFMSINI